MVDGNDVVAVYQATREVVANARAGGGPFFLELKTYLWHVHNEAVKFLGDPRPAEEVESWKRRDPIIILESRLIENRIATGQELMVIKNEAKALIVDAIRYALASPLPQPEDVLTDVFSDQINVS